MFKISQLTNQGIINFNNNKISVETFTTLNSDGAIEKQINLNFGDDLQLIENDISSVKEITENYKRSLNGWIKEETKEIENIWSEKRNPGLNQYLKQLSEWTKKTISTIIYDSNVNEDFCETVALKTKDFDNIMFIAETDGGNIFGSYHSILPSKPSQWIIKDDKHFVFSLSNSFGTKPTKFTPINNECYPLWFYKTTPALYCVQYFCHISSNKQCYINSKEWSGKSFGEMYNDTLGKDGKIFTKTVYPTRFGLKRLICLTWN